MDMALAGGLDGFHLDENGNDSNHAWLPPALVRSTPGDKALSMCVKQLLSNLECTDPRQVEDAVSLIKQNGDGVCIRGAINALVKTKIFCETLFFYGMESRSGTTAHIKRVHNTFKKHNVIWMHRKTYYCKLRFLTRWHSCVVKYACLKAVGGKRREGINVTKTFNTAYWKELNTMCKDKMQQSSPYKRIQIEIPSLLTTLSEIKVAIKSKNISASLLSSAYPGDFTDMVLGIHHIAHTTVLVSSLRARVHELEKKLKCVV